MISRIVTLSHCVTVILVFFSVAVTFGLVLPMAMAVTSLHLVVAVSVLFVAILEMTVVLLLDLGMDVLEVLVEQLVVRLHGHGQILLVGDAVEQLQGLAQGLADSLVVVQIGLGVGPHDVAEGGNGRHRQDAGVIVVLVVKAVGGQRERGVLFYVEVVAVGSD